MEPAELMVRVARVLDAMGLPYAVGGSMASMRYGEPRFTNDIDIVVELPSSRVEEFARHFPVEEFYLSTDAAQQAIRFRSQFNIIHPESGLKVDVILPPADAHGQTQLERARDAEAMPGERVRYASPEDVIIRKLLYYQEGGSSKHLRDIASMLKISREDIDREEIGRWADELGVREIWDRIISGV